jgi:hypothetical protein
VLLVGKPLRLVSRAHDRRGTYSTTIRSAHRNWSERSLRCADRARIPIAFYSSRHLRSIRARVGQTRNLGMG